MQIKIDVVRPEIEEDHDWRVSVRSILAREGGPQCLLLGRRERRWGAHAPWAPQHLADLK